ncbi:MAG: cytochrome B6 [Chloroflexi bacterium 13_1_40CM_68_15]|nr:MAG: cytochrome B6 [Chloroflexi bacterium 13_1_40CM_68_15]
MLEIPAQIWQKTKTSYIWRSLFRHGYPDSRKNQSLAVFTNVFLHLHPVKVRRHALAIPYTWCMGGLSFFLFLVLTLTGTLLMFYYHPSVDGVYNAYGDIKDLETVVVFGQLLRNMHRWAAHGMVITVFLHMIRVFYTGSYKPPREFNWVIGTLLFFFTILLSYTGYLLPWDQLSFWAVTVGYEIARATPVIGDEFAFVFFGGFQLGPNALLRFYVFHVVGFPLIVGFLIAIHFWRIRKDGGITGPL